jgi:hypothetical protein
MSELIEEDVIGGCTKGGSEAKPKGIRPLVTSQVFASNFGLKKCFVCVD